MNNDRLLKQYVESIRGLVGLLLLGCNFLSMALGFSVGVWSVDGTTTSNLSIIGLSILVFCVQIGLWEVLQRFMQAGLNTVKEYYEIGE